MILGVVLGLAALFSPFPIPMPENIPYFDKYLHFLFFLFLSCSCSLIFSNSSPIFRQLPGLALAICSEWIQHAFFPLREFSLTDAAANLSGFLLGIFICFLFWRLCVFGKTHLE